MAKGWIKLYRDIQNSWMWEERVFSKGQAWIDLLLSASEKNKNILIDNSLVEVNTLCIATSQSSLMDRWGWGKEKVRSFLKLLESKGMIVVKTTARYTLITIIHHETHQLDLQSSIDVDKEWKKANCSRFIEDKCKCYLPNKEGECWYIQERSEDQQSLRTTTEYATWRTNVFERDNYTCQHCKQHGGALNAHHKKAYADYPELRVELSNGITLCEECHKAEHRRLKEGE